MKNQNIISEELSRMKFLTGYKKGVVVSEQAPTNFGQFGYYAGMSATQQPQTQDSQARQKNITGAYCSVKDGKIVAPGYKNDGRTWVDYVKLFKVTDVEIAEAKKSCPNVNVSQQILKWIPEDFPAKPLKFMMKGENVKKLQQALDVRNRAGQPNITGNFYTATEAALIKKVNELGLKYDRNVGLTQDDFNKIIGAQEEKVQTNVNTKDITGNTKLAYQPKGLGTTPVNQANYAALNTQQ